MVSTIVGGVEISWYFDDLDALLGNSFLHPKLFHFEVLHLATPFAIDNTDACPTVAAYLCINVLCHFLIHLFN